MDKLAEAMRIEGFTGGVFNETGYVVRCLRTNAAILVDPGATTPDMLSAARAAGARVEAIVLTHAHVDHVEGLALASYETNAPIFLHPDDAALYDAAPEIARSLGVSLERLPPVDYELLHDTDLRFGDCRLRVRHAPGHSPGHVILVSSNSALVGDVIFRGSIGRTDLPGGDLDSLLESIQREILSLPNDVVLYSGHGPQTTVGEERCTNPLRPAAPLSA